MTRHRQERRPGFLASVADLAEMELACRGGADIVDLKQPAFGALGAWSLPALTHAVALWRSWGDAAPSLSATAGDQPMVPALLRAAATDIAGTGVPLVKVGLFASPSMSDCIEALTPLAAQHRLIGVLFADQQPDFAVVGALGRAGFTGIMLDTADKTSGPLTAHLDALTLGQFVQEARRHGLMTGLAGSLTLNDIRPLASAKPDYLGFRGALCGGGRTGTLDPARLDAIRLRLEAHADRAAD